MQKQTILTISQNELIEILASRDVIVPICETTMQVRDGVLEISWPDRSNLTARSLDTLGESVRLLMQKDEKIPAIKLCRAWTGWGLKEAKDWCEAQAA